MQGDILLGFFGCLVELFFNLVLGWIFWLLFFLFSLDIFSLLLITGEVQFKHDEHVGSQGWFSQEQQHKEEAHQGMVGAGVLSAALCAASMQTCPPCSSTLLFNS